MFLIRFLIFVILFLFLIQNFNNNKNINKNLLKIGLCVIGKNENLYIKEFIKHYKKIGYDHIFLYDNNDINGESFENIIKNEIYKGFVSIINYRGYKGKNINPQFKAYKDCYENNNNNFSWLSFFDIDEYLELIPNNLKIRNFLNLDIFNKCQVIKINWVCYTSNNSLYYENKPLQQRLNIPLFKLDNNKHIKSTVRGKLPKNYWIKVNNPHSSVNNYISCSSSGKIIDSSSPYNFPAEYKFAYLKHYQMKSFEEYCLKIKRGRPIPNYKLYQNERISYLFNKYKNDISRLNILKKIFNDTI